MDDVEQVAPGDGVGDCPSGFVEEEDKWVVNQGLGQFGALAHPFGIAFDRPIGVFRHAYGFEHLRGRLTRFPAREARKQGARRDEFSSRHPFIKGILLGTEADVTVEPRIVPGAL